MSSFDRNRPNLAIILCTLLVMRTAAALYRAFIPPGNPHAWRQFDTLGVSARYFSRWFLENETRYPLLPAVLNSGDAYGIMRMELPLVNLLGAFGFFAGPDFGQTLACLLLFTLHGLLLWFNYRVWYSIDIAGIPMRMAILLLPVFSLTDQYFSRYMPDVTAILLVLAAIGLTWNTASMPRYSVAIVLASLGMLIKPPAVAMFGILLAQPNMLRMFRQNTLWVCVSLVAPLLYYTVGLRWLGTLQDMPDLFKYNADAPWENLRSFFSAPQRLVHLLLMRCMPAGMLAVIIAGLMHARYQQGTKAKTYASLWWILGAQLLLVAALDGYHAYTHEYYFLAMAPVLALLFVGFWQNNAPRWLRYLLLLMIFGRFVDMTVTDLRAFNGDGKRLNVDRLYAECRALKAEAPEVPWRRGQAFRSSTEPFPRLGLCFGEIQGSATAPYGFFYAHEPLPADCTPWLSKTQVILARCK